MRRSLGSRRGRVGGEAYRFMGALLVAAGLIIFWRLLPVWLLWGLVALCLLVVGLFLLFG